MSNTRLLGQQERGAKEAEKERRVRIKARTRVGARAGVGSRTGVERQGSRVGVDQCNSFAAATVC